MAAESVVLLAQDTTALSYNSLLQTTGLGPIGEGHSRRCLVSIIPLHAAPTELARASGAVVTINLALLTELDQRPSPRKGRER